MFVRTRMFGLCCLFFVITVMLTILPGIIEAKSEKDLVIGKAVAVKSKVLNEERILLIHETSGLQSNAGSHPVLYVLDGETHFMYVSGIVDFLTQRGLAPAMIVVGIKNVDRNRDFTFVKNDKLKSSCGGEAFIEFLDQEVFPFIEKNYSTAPYRLLFGHSLGGLFAVHTMTHFPDLFNAYFAISPYMVYGEQYLLTGIENGEIKLPEKPVFLSISLGDEKELMDGYKKFEQILEKQAPTTLTWKSELFPDDDHSSLTLPSFYAALRELFKDWQIDKSIMAQGMEAIDGHYKMLSERFGYSIPTPEWVLNIVGYTFLQAKNVDDAILILKENVRRYPESANVYDSLGEAYELKGNLAEAVRNYEIAVKRAKEKNHIFLDTYIEHLKHVQEAQKSTK